jgi:Tfp pilus assembly protein PilO
MINKSLIKDAHIRAAIDELNNRLERIEKIPQLPSDTTLAKLIERVNKITDSVKRKR